MKVIVDELLVEYSASGKGRTVLLLHGWGDSKLTFKSLESTLSQNYRVICLDLPGFGATQTPKSTFDLGLYAKFVARFLNKIEERDVYAIIGHSNGGAIAVKALSTNELSVQKLVLLASSGVRSTFQARKKALRMAAKAAKIPIAILPKDIQTKIKKNAYKKIGSDMFVAENMQDTFRNVVSEDLTVPSKSIEADTLLIYGSEDKATPASYGESFSQSIAGSKLEVLQGAGHFIHLERPKEVSELIEEFLNDK